MKKKTDTLHLMLTFKWYDMIASGEKKEEYREMTPHWRNRFGPFPKHWQCDPQIFWHAMLYHYVCFHRGYTNKTMTFTCNGMRVGKPNPEWCEPEMKDKQVFIIRLGERVK